MTDCDHEALVADEELHEFHTGILSTADVVLFGRKTYQLMEAFWPLADQGLQRTESMIRFADKINSLRKINFPKTLDKATWNHTTVIRENAVEEVLKLKQHQEKTSR